jgi:hypothetical protein
MEKTRLDHFGTFMKDIFITFTSMIGGLFSAFSNLVLPISLKIKKFEPLLHLSHLKGVMLDVEVVVTFSHALQYHLHVVVQNATPMPEF